MSASQIGQNGRGKLIAVDKATEENCRSCDPDHDRKIHNGKCPCCEVITKFQLFMLLFIFPGSLLTFGRLLSLVDLLSDL